VEQLRLLGFRPGENVSLCHKHPGQQFCASVVPFSPEVVTRRIASYADADQWYGINSLRSADIVGRGCAEDVARLSCLPGDLDSNKPGGCPDLETAERIAAGVSVLLGLWLAMIADSGHGWHLYWLVADGYIGEHFPQQRAEALLDDFATLIRGVAARLGVTKLDSVFDLPRVLRLAGSTNWKDPEHPVPVLCCRYIYNGSPVPIQMTVAELEESLASPPVQAVAQEYRERWGKDRERRSGRTRSAPRGQKAKRSAEGIDYSKVPAEPRRNYWHSTKAALVRDMATATVGDRNNTLNECIYYGDRVRQTCCGEQAGRDEFVEAMSEAAADRGLADPEISRTVASALRAAGRDGRWPVDFGGHDAEGSDSKDAKDDGNLFDDDPIPLTRTVEIPPFPTDALPKPIANMVRRLAIAAQVDEAMVAVPALGALSACTGGNAEIQIRAGWVEPLNLYTVTVAHSGERKSSVQRTMMRPIYEAERQLAQNVRAERRERETEKKVATRNAQLLSNAAAKVEDDDTEQTRAARLQDAIAVAEMADSIVVPEIPRLVTDDVTPEAIASLLAEQGGRMAVISSEGGPFDIIAGRYSQGSPNLDVWLKGHCGDMLRVDRKGRGTEHVDKPAITMALMIQPSVLVEIAATRQFRGRGLLARFLYACPHSKVGNRKIAQPPVGETTKEAYETVVRDLAVGMRSWGSDPAMLTLTEEAHQTMVAIETEIEPTLARDGELGALADWGAKLPGAIARIAGNLHLAELGAEQGPRVSVTADTIRAAYRIGEYFMASAIAAFHAMGADSVTANAVWLLERIHGTGCDGLSERDIYLAGRHRIPTMADLKPVLHRLLDHGWLVRLHPAAEQQTRPGRPASPRYRIFPIAHKSHKSHKYSD
jgi:hypothetical protein